MYSSLLPSFDWRLDEPELPLNTFAESSSFLQSLYQTVCNILKPRNNCEYIDGVFKLKKIDNGAGFFEWIGIERYPNYGSSKFLGLALGFLILLVTAAIFVGGIATILQFLAIVLQAGADHDAIRNVGLIAVAIVGAPFIVWRATVAQKQADTAEQSHITDQINKAVAGLGADKITNKIGRPVTIYSGKSSVLTHLVDDPEAFKLKSKSIELTRYHDQSLVGPDRDEIFDGLHIEVKSWEDIRTEIEWQGKVLALEDGATVAKAGDWSVFTESLPNIEVRVGAIYALERISKDSIRDHIQIMEILTAYVRENAPVKDLEPAREPFFPSRPRTDIEAAIDVLARRSIEAIRLEHSKKFRLDLRNVDLSGVSVVGGSFEGAFFTGSRLEAVSFRSTNLRAVRLSQCLLNHAEFFDTNLDGAILDGSTINRVGGWNNSIISAASMRGVSLACADITAINHFPSDKTHSPTFGSKDTKLAFSLDESRDQHKGDIQLFSSNRPDKDEEALRERLTVSGFLYWSPYTQSDLGNYDLYKRLRDELGFVGFPYDN